MKRHEVKDEKPKVYIEYTSDSEGGEPLTDDRWSDRSDTHVTLEVKHLYKSEPKHLFFKDSLDVEPKVLEAQFVYLVVVRYKTGDTFGSSYGNFHFYSVRATQEEALEDKVAIESPRGEKDHYRPWDGYFERLEDVEIHTMPLVP
jgi:hypothetical protein